MGDVARQDTAQSGPVSDEGDNVRRRRERLGMNKGELAELAGVNRDTLAAIEAGEGFRRVSLTKIERALSEAENESGLTTPLPSAPTSAPRMVVVRIKSEHGEVVVEGPVEDIATLRAEALALLRGMAKPEGS